MTALIKLISALIGERKFKKMKKNQDELCDDLARQMMMARLSKEPKDPYEALEEEREREYQKQKQMEVQEQDEIDKILADKSEFYITLIPNFEESDAEEDYISGSPLCLELSSGTCLAVFTNNEMFQKIWENRTEDFEGFGEAALCNSVSVQEIYDIAKNNSIDNIAFCYGDDMTTEISLEEWKKVVEYHETKTKKEEEAQE